MDDLIGRGIVLENNLEKVRTRDVLITAHGASDRQLQRVRDQGLNVIEATCPLVHHAHRCVKRLVAEGFHPVIVGKRDHIEVRGLTEDLSAFDIILTEEDVMQLASRPKFGLAAQTTQPIDKVRHLAACVQRRFPNSEVRFEDTVCQPTKQRQKAAVEIAQQADIVIVIGGAESNNTRELVQTCAKSCSRVFHVHDEKDLRSIWFHSQDTVVGVTAGTSTPDQTIQQVIRWLEEFASFQQQLTHEGVV